MNRSFATALVVGIFCTLAPFAAQFYGDHRARALMIDFRAYYCAANAAARNENPYFTSAIHPCESTTVKPYYKAPRAVTVPTPYPPYVLMLLYPFVLLPFSIAAPLWWVILALFLAAATYALAQITRQPALVAWAVLVLSLGLVSFDSGNLVIVGIAALLLAAMFLQRGEFYAAAFALALSSVEPQLALPAIVAALLRFPAMRLTLVLLLAMLATAALAQSGLAHSFFYFTAVVPAHALSEVSRDNQYSLSTVVAALGASDTIAVKIGALSYGASCVLGITAGLRLSRDRLDPAIAILIPATFSLIGGSFVHTGEIAIAAPAGLLLLRRAEDRQRLLLFVIVLLAIPWMLATSAAMFLAGLFPAGYLAYALSGRNRTFAICTGLLATIGILGLFAASAHSLPHRALQMAPHPPIDPRLAENAWRSLVLGNATNALRMWLLRIPTWIGLVTLAVTALSLVRVTRQTIPLTTRA